MRKIIATLILILILIMPAVALADKAGDCATRCTGQSMSLYPTKIDETTEYKNARQNYYNSCYASCMASPITSKEDITNLVITATNWFAGIVFAIAVIMIIYGGVLYMTAAGSEEKAKTARSLLLYACIGIAVALLAFGAQALISSFLGMGSVK